jgi:hypothetical protein
MNDLQERNRLNLKVVTKGTHILPVSEWNNDRPSPCECVAEALADLEYRIGELIKSGGAAMVEESGGQHYHNARQALSGLNLALNAASQQGWKLELEERNRV